MTLNLKSKLDCEPAKFKLADFAAMLKYLKTAGHERTANYFVDQFEICDHCAIRIHAPRVTEGNSDQRDKI